MTRAVLVAVLLSALTGCIAVTNPSDRARYHPYQRDWRNAQRDYGHWDNRRDWRYEDKKYHHNWRRGERLPAAYTRYRIFDYRRCGLRSPPRGAHWIRVDRDAVLAAIATGIVLDVVYNAFR
jgi:Ni/Co efflux regulator RcnB